MDYLKSIVLLLLTITVPARSQQIKSYISEIARCAHLHGKLYYAFEDRCYWPMMQGPCSTGRMLVLSNTNGLGVCTPDPCLDLTTGQPVPWEVLVHGACVNMYSQPSCQALGEMMRWLVTGEVECACDDGWGRLGPSTKCQQESSRGLCPKGQIVRPKVRPCTRLGLYVTSRHWRDKDLETGGDQNFRTGVERVKQLNCGEQGGEECCRILTEGQAIQLEVEDIKKATGFQPTMYECGPNETPSGNPCPSDELPWPQQSSSQCYPVLPSFRNSRSDNCILQLEGHQISCMEDDDVNAEIDLRSVAEPGRARRCRRGRVYSRFTRGCVSK